MGSKKNAKCINCRNYQHQGSQYCLCKVTNYLQDAMKQRKCQHFVKKSAEIDDDLVLDDL